MPSRPPKLKETPPRRGYLTAIAVAALSLLAAAAAHFFRGAQPHSDNRTADANTPTEAALRLALHERSLGGVRLARQAAASLDDDNLLALLNNIMGWCATRSVRFRQRDFLIGRAAASNIKTLVNGGDDAQAEMVASLLALAPNLKQQGAELVHAALRTVLTHEHVENSAELSNALQDRVTLLVCGPFIEEVVSGGGHRKGLDAAHIAASFAAMEGSIPLLSTLHNAGYLLEHSPLPPNAKPRCRSCPVCCLNDGVERLPHPGMRFSARHAAAATGQLEVLEWLESHLSSDATVNDDGEKALLLPPRDLVFDTKRLESVEPDSVSKDEQRRLRGGGWSSTAEAATDASAAVPCQIHTVSGEDVANHPARFFDQYIRNAQPVLIRGLLYKDRALAASIDVFSREAMLRRFGETVWEIGDIPYEGRYKSSAPEPMRLRDYVERHIDGCHQQNETGSRPQRHSCHAYVFAEAFERSGVPIQVKAEKLIALPTWAQKRTRRVSGLQFFLGPKDSGAPMHFHQAAFNILVHGKKRWYLMPPAHATFSMEPAFEWIEKRKNATADVVTMSCARPDGGVNQ